MELIFSDYPYGIPVWRLILGGRMSGENGVPFASNLPILAADGFSGRLSMKITTLMLVGLVVEVERG
jgi:hypothetical protein